LTFRSFKSFSKPHSLVVVRFRASPGVAEVARPGGAAGVVAGVAPALVEWLVVVRSLVV
jgi:hypothetical protein